MTGIGLLVVALAAAAPRVQVDRWTMREGLPQSSVTGLLQADSGEVWITTFGGISRFDGHVFHNFSPSTSAGLDVSRFVDLAQSPDGALWFASPTRGVYRYQHGRFDAVGPRVPVHELAVDAEGRVWGASAVGFVEVSSAKPRIVPVPEGLSSVETLGDGRVVGTGRTTPPRCALPPVDCLPPGPPRPGVARLDRHGDDLWLHGTLGVHALVDGGWQLVVQEPTVMIQPGFSFAWDGATWLVRDGALHRRDGRPVDVPAPDRRIRSALVDGEGGLWLGLDGAGLMRIRRFPVEVHAPGGSVRHVAIDREGHAWFGSCRALHRLGAPVPPLPDGLEETRCRLVWRGSHDEILLRAYRPDDRRLRVLALRDDRFEVVYTGETSRRHILVADGGSWFSHGGTLYVVDGDAARPVARASDLGFQQLAPLAPDRGGGLWLAGDDHTLVRLEDGVEVERIELPDRAPVRHVLPRGDRLLVATYGAGLFGVRGTRIDHLTPAQGLCDYALSHIFDPGDGTLWFNTNRGLGRVVETELWRALDDPASTVRCHVVESGEANGPHGAIGPDGHLWAPTIDGLVELDPSRAFPAHAPRLVLRAARYGDVDLLGASAGAIRGAIRGAHPLTVRYAGIQFDHPRQITYQYRLLGRDDAWSAPTHAREVAWHLPPGPYRFEVRATGSHGLTSPVVGLSFVRRAETWETPWFRAGLPMGIVVSIAIGLWTAWRVTDRQNRALAAEVRDRERAERRLLEEQRVREQAQAALHHSQRLDAIGRLAGGIAHDFNNLLLVVSSHAAELADQAAPRVRRAGRSLQGVVERAVSLTRRLLVVGRQDPTMPQLIDLGQSMQRDHAILRRLIREDIALELDVQGAAWVVLDPVHLDRLVTNLIVNARDAIGGRGTIRVTVAEHGPDRVALAVEDDGHGIDPEHLPHLFEPYFTTKTAGRGTGLGLATAHSVVREAGGEIRVEPREGGGTRFTVLLPRAAPPARPAPDDPAPPPPVRRSRRLRVLVVDDQPEVARSLGRHALGLGWFPHLATEPYHAYRVLEREHIDVIISDVVMPGTSGPALVAEARRRQPDVSVVLVSGHPAGVLDDLEEELRGIPVLGKPFTREALAVAVAEALER